MLFLKQRVLIGPFSLSVSFDSINASFTYAEANGSIGHSQEEDYLTVKFTILYVPVSF